MKTRKNQFDVEWHYALEVWDAIVNGCEVPPVPDYSVWEIDDRGREKLIKRIPCRVMNIVGSIK